MQSPPAVALEFICPSTFIAMRSKRHPTIHTVSTSDNQIHRLHRFSTRAGVHSSSNSLGNYIFPLVFCLQTHCQNMTHFLGRGEASSLRRSYSNQIRKRRPFAVVLPSSGVTFHSCSRVVSYNAGLACLRDLVDPSSTSDKYTCALPMNTQRILFQWGQLQIPRFMDNMHSQFLNKYCGPRRLLQICRSSVYLFWCTKALLSNA